MTVFSWLALNSFLVVILLVIRPIKIDIPFTKKKYHVSLNRVTAPVLAVSFLLATKSINFKVVIDGFVGSSGIQPYSIMILFFSLAYICISLDKTGLVQLCAFWVSNRSGSHGRKLFTYLFILFVVTSALTSNDVVILTGTVFLVYFTRVTGIDPPIAFLMAEFTATNIASMALYIGNPTNVVVSQAYNISFLQYSAWMLAPTLTSILLAYIMLRIIFRNYIPKEVNPPNRSPRSVLDDPKGAIVGCVVLTSSLVTLIGTSFAGVPIWIVTLPHAAIMLFRDIYHDLTTSHAAIPDIEMDSSIEKSQSSSITSSNQTSCRSSSKVQGEEDMGVAQKIPSSLFESKLPTVHAVVVRMPWTVLPFALGMFILVEALSSLGWISEFANALVMITPSFVPAVFVIGFLSALLCNLLNNLPMTILVTRVLQHQNFSQSTHMTPVIMKGCVFALIIGSNLGACLTFVGSLAGLMWENILKEKSTQMSYWQFLRWNLGVMPVVAFGACAVLAFELWIVYEQK